MRNSTRLRALDSVRSVFGRLKNQFETPSRKGLKDEQLKTKLVRETTHELMAPLETRVMLSTAPNLVLTPNQNVGGTLQGTYAVVDISALTGGDIYMNDETAAMGRLFKVVRDANGQVTGVTPIGQIAQVNGSAVIQLSSLTTGANGNFYTAGVDGSSFLPVDNVGKDLQTAKLSVQALAISGENDPASGLQRIFIIDSNGSTLDLYELRRSADGAADKLTPVGLNGAIYTNVLDDKGNVVTQLPVLGMQSAAIVPTGNSDVVSIGYRADEVSPQKATGYVADSFDIRGVTVRPQDLSTNDQTYLLNRRDPLRTHFGLPEFELWQVTRDPLTQAILNNTYVGAVKSGGKNVIRADAIESDPETGLMTTLGITYDFSPVPTIGLQGNLGDSYAISDIVVTRLTQATGTKGSNDSIFAVVDDNSFADLYRIRQGTAQTPDPTSGVTSWDGLADPNDPNASPMQRLGRMVDTKNQPLYFVQALASDWSTAMSPTGSVHNYVWAIGSSSPSANAAMSLYRFDMNGQAGTPGKEAYQAVEEYPLNDGVGSLNYVVKGLAYKPWTQDLYPAPPFNDLIPDQGELYAIVAYPDGDHIVKIDIPSPGFDALNQPTPVIIPTDKFGQQIIGRVTDLAKLTQTVSSIDFQMNPYSPNPTWNLYGLTGKVGDANRSLASVATSGSVGVIQAVDPYMRGLSFGTMQTPLGDAVRVQPFSIKGSLQINSRDQLMTSQWTSAYYSLSETSAAATLKYKLLFNSSDPTAPAQLSINALTEAQVRDWEIRPGRSDGEFKALATDPTTGVIYGVLEVVDNAKLGSGVKQILVKVDPSLKQSTKWGDFVQVDPVITYEDTNNDGILERVGGVITVGGADTQILEMDFTRTGELIGLQRKPNDQLYNTPATNSLVAINRINPSKSTQLVDDSIEYTGMRALYNQFPVGLGSSPLGRYLSVVPDPKPVDDNGLKLHTIIPNKYNQVAGSLSTGPAIIDLDTSTVVDFNTGLKFTYAFTGTEGTEQLVRFKQTVGSDGKPVINGYDIVDNRIEVDAVGYADYLIYSKYQIDDIKAMSVGADGSIYFAGQHTGTPRPAGTIEGEYGLGAAGLQNGGGIAVSPDGLTAWVVESINDKGIKLGRLERDDSIDPITGKPIGMWIPTGSWSNLGYKSSDGLEYDPINNLLYAIVWQPTSMKEEDAINRLIAIDPDSLGEVSSTALFDLSQPGVLSPEYLLDYVTGGSGYSTGTITIQRRDGQVLSLNTADLVDIGDLQALVTSTFGTGVTLEISGNKTLRIVDVTPGDTSIKTSNELWQLNNGKGISLNSGAGVPDMVLTFNAGGSDLLTLGSELKYLNNGAGVDYHGDGVTADLKIDFFKSDFTSVSDYVTIRDVNLDGKITISDVNSVLVSDTGGRISNAVIGDDKKSLKLTFSGTIFAGVTISDFDSNVLTAEDLGINGSFSGNNQFFSNIVGKSITPVTDPAALSSIKQVDIRDIDGDGVITVQDVIDSIKADSGGLIVAGSLTNEFEDVVVAGKTQTITYHKGISLVFDGDKYSSVVISDVPNASATTATDLHLVGTYTNALGNRVINGSALTPTVYTTIVSGTAADILNIDGSSKLGIVNGTELNPVKLYLRYQTTPTAKIVLHSMGQIVRNPFDNQFYVAGHGLVGTVDTGWAADFLLNVQVSGAGTGNTALVGNQLGMGRTDVLHNNVIYNRRASGMYFNQYNELVVFENRSAGYGGVTDGLGYIFTYNITGALGSQVLTSTQGFNLPADGGPDGSRKILSNTYDLAMDNGWRSYTNVTGDVLASGEELYQIQLYQVQSGAFNPGDSGQVLYKGELVSSTGHVIDDVNGITFNVPGGAYILTNQYSAPQVFQIRTDAISDFYTNKALAAGGGLLEGEIIINPRGSAYGFDISSVYAFDIEFTRTNKLTVIVGLKSQISFPWKDQMTVLPTVGLDADGLVTGKILAEVNLEDGAQQSFVRALTTDNNQTQYFINPFDSHLLGFSTDVSGVFSSIYSNPTADPGGDRMWLGLPDEVYISPSNQTIYRIDSKTAEAKPIAELKDTSLQLQKPVSSVFQALSFNPVDGKLYGVLRDVANGDVNRLISLATSNPNDPYSLTGEFFREGTSNGRIQLDDGRGVKSEVNLSGLVFVKVGNEYRMVAEDQISQRLITIDPVVTDRSAGLTAFSSTKDLTGLMIDRENVIFSIFDTPGGFDQLWKSVKSEERTLSLYEVNPTNAIATRKDFILDPAGAKVARVDLPTMAFDQATNRLYGVIRTAAGDSLVVINTTDGKMTPVSLGDTVIKIDGSASNINTMEFRDGVLYAYNDPAPGKRNLVIIDATEPSKSKTADTHRDLGIGALPINPDPRLVGLAMEPLSDKDKSLAGRFFSIMPTDVSNPNAPIPFDELWISDRMFAYNQEFVLPEVKSLNTEYIKLAPYLLTQIYGPQPNQGGTVQSPNASQIIVNPNPTVITTKAGGTLTIYNNGYLSYQAAKYFNGVDSLDVMGLPLAFQAQSGDGTLITKYATMTFTVTEVNDAPVAPSTQVKFNADLINPITTTAELLLQRAVNNGALAGPADPALTVVREEDQTLNVTIPLDAGSSKQTVYQNGFEGNLSKIAGYITVENNLDGSLLSYTFTPQPGFSGQAAFKYNLVDGGDAAKTNGVYDPQTTQVYGIIDVQDRPRVSNFVPVTPNPRNIPVDQIEVVFSRPINAATFSIADVTLLAIGAGGVQTPIDISGATILTTGDPTKFIIANLSSYTGGTADKTLVYRIDVNAETVQDTGGVDGAGLGSVNWTNDREIPKVISFGPVTPSLKNTGTPFVDVKFSEPIDPATFTIADLQLTRTFNGKDIAMNLAPASIALLSDSDPLVYRISGLSGITSQEGVYTFTLDTKGISDPAGNFGDESLNTKWTVDTTSPTPVSVVINGQTTPMNVPLNEVWVTFSEAIDATSFTAKGDLVLTLTHDKVVTTIDISGAAIAVDPLNPARFLVSSLSGYTTAEGTYTLTVVSEGIIDLAGNAGKGSKSTDWVMDLTPPQVKEIGPLTTPVNHSLSSIVVTFSEAINAKSFTLDDLKLTYQTITSGGPVDVSLKVSGATVSIDPTDPTGTRFLINNLEVATVGFASEDTTYTLYVDATGVVDIAGNAGTGILSDSWVNDRTEPSVTVIGPVTPNPRNSSVNSVTVKFSEKIDLTSFTYQDLKLTLKSNSGVISTIDLSGVTIVQNALDPLLFTIGNMGGITFAEGTFTLSIDPTKITDLAGNAGLPVDPLPSTSWVTDVTRPQITKVIPVMPSAVNTPVSSFDVYFSEEIKTSTFTTASMSLTRGGTALDLSGVTITQDGSNPLLYHLTGFDSLTAQEGAYAFSIRADFVIDLAGNVGVGGSQQAWTMDTTALTMKSLGANITSPRKTQVSGVDVVFNEPINISTFDLTDLALTRDGVPVSLVGVTIQQTDPSDATRFQILGLGGDRTAPEGKYVLSVDLTKIQDQAGNTGTSKSQVTWVTDTSAPTAKLTATDITSRTTAPKTFTIIFKDVAGVSAASLATGSINVFGPGGFTALATLQTITPSGTTAAPEFTVTYSLDAPGGEWNALDNGSYSVIVNPNTVSDILDQKMAQSVLGTFNVSILGVANMQVTQGGNIINSPYTANFGVHNLGDNSVIDFVFKNTGDGALTGVDVNFTKAGYIILVDLPTTIAAGGEAILRIKLDTSTPRDTVSNPVPITITTDKAGSFVINAVGEVFNAVPVISGKATTYIDSSGDTVSVMLKGPGSGILYFTGSGDASRLTLSDTTIASSLSITATGNKGNQTSLKSITIGNPDDVNDQTSIGIITASAVDISSAIRLAGVARTITIGNLTNTLVEVGQSDTYTGQVGITAKRVIDTRFQSVIGVSSFTAWDWLDTVASYNSALEAPVVGTVTMQGYPATKLPGNFQADVSISGPLSGVGLNSFRATGIVSSSNWNVGGTGINSINALSFTGLNIDTPGKITTVVTTGTSTVSGMIHALSVGSMNLRGPVAGLSVELGSSSNPNQMDIQSFVAQSNVTNFLLTTNGKAGTITINGNLGDGISMSKITIGNSLTSLTAFSATDSVIDVAGNVSSIRFTKALPSGATVTDSTINAFAVSTFTVTGNVVDSAFNLGDQTFFNADKHVPVTGVAVPNTLPAVTTFNVTGSFIDSSLKVGGNARSITISKDVTESDVRVIGNIVTFNTGPVNNAVNGLVTDRVIKADQIGTFSAKGITQGTIDAVVINTLNVTGNITKAIIALSSAPSTLKALGAFTVSGGITDTTVVSAGNVGNVSIGAAGATNFELRSAGSIGNVTTAGAGALTSSQIRAQSNIGQVSLAKITDSIIFAGIANTVDELPTLADFTNTAATIAGVTIRTTGTTFIRSYIAGGTLTKVALKGVDPVNAAGLFGVLASEKVGNYTATGQVTRTNLTVADDYNAVGNFRLRVL